MTLQRSYIVSNLALKEKKTQQKPIKHLMKEEYICLYIIHLEYLSA